MSKHKTFFLLLIAAAVAYGSSLKYGFSQDDWFHLTLAKAGSLSEFMNFFNPFRVDWIFFRPLSTQLPYWLAVTIFGLSGAPVFMHFLMLIIHAVNGYLVTQIAKKYVPGQAPTILGLVYVVASSHFLSLFYIGAVQQLISTLFSLLTLRLFLSKSQPSQFGLALLTLLALLSKELALRIPLILFALAVLSGHAFWPAIKKLLGPLIVSLLYLGLRAASFGQATEYVMIFSPATTLATLMWYFLFGIGFPELLLNYGLSGGLVNFTAFFGDNLFRLSILLSALPLGGLLLFRFIKTVQLRSWSTLVFPLIALLSLLPILFLPTHRYPHYLDLSILFFGIWILQSLNLKKTLAVILTSSIVAGMLASIAVETGTHWTIKRAELAKKEAAKIIANGSCSNPDGLILKGTPAELQQIGYALSLANGPRIICQNQALPVYYVPGEVSTESGLVP